MNRKVLAELARLVVIPVIEIPDVALAEPLADALIEGGLRCAEITFRTEAGVAALSWLAGHRPELVLGAGTVLTPSQVDRALDAGATFLVSPGFSPEVVDHALSLEATMLPGCCTPTEIEMARSRGLDTVKFFPAEASGGADYVKALSAPYSSMRFIPTGGINAGKLADYLSISEVVAVGGSWMASRALIEARQFETIAERTREAVELVATLRPVQR